MSACPVNYPSIQEATPCFVEVVKLLRSGKILDDVDHALKHVWVVQGAAFGAVFCDPDSPPLIGDTDYSTDAGAAAILESATPADGVKGAIPWLLVIKVASEIIRRLLEKKLSG